MFDFASSRNSEQIPNFARASKEMERLMVLEPAMHLLTAGPRTRRLQPGNHGASGARKPREIRLRGVAPRRKVGSLNRQVSGGHTSKVRRRSRCRAKRFFLSQERRTRGSSGS